MIIYHVSVDQNYKLFKCDYLYECRQKLCMVLMWLFVSVDQCVYVLLSSTRQEDVQMAVTLPHTLCLQLAAKVRSCLGRLER